MTDSALLPPVLPVAAVTVEAVAFGALALVAVSCALLSALAPRIVHAAFGLLGTFLGVAGLYALLGADFLALAQVVVYVGGILVLLVFGVLLTARARPRLGRESRPAVLVPSLVGGLVFAGLLAATLGTGWRTAPPGEPRPTTADLGRALLDPSRQLVAFELASVLLLAALVGAAYLVRRRRDR